MKNILAAVAIALAVCGTLIWIAGIGSDTLLSIKNSGYVTVKGYATQKITSDRGIFEVTAVAQNADLKLAYDKLAKDRDLVTGYIAKGNFPVKDILAQPVEVEEKHKVNEKGHATPEIDRFVVSQTFRSESPDVKKIESLAAGIGDLLGQGVQVKVGRPQFVYTKFEDLKIRMIGRATGNAKDRAEVLSKNGKFKLGKVSDVRVGIFQITPLHSTDVSDWGVNDTTTIEKEIKCVVDVKYFVK